MANKRGFDGDSGKLVQVVTDGDRDLRDLCSEYFPEAEHTVDSYHVLERVHKAGQCLLREGSQELADWFDEQRHRLLDDQAELIVRELRVHLAAIPKTGPGNKGRREFSRLFIDTAACPPPLRGSYGGASWQNTDALLVDVCLQADRIRLRVREHRLLVEQIDS